MWHTPKYGDPYSEFVLYIYQSKVHTHTHTVNTHTEQWAAILARAPGEQLGVRGLAQGYLSRGFECGKPRLPLICVPKRNEGLAGLERHKGE